MTHLALRPQPWLLSAALMLVACNRRGVDSDGSPQAETTEAASEAELDDSDPEVCMEAAGGNLYYQCGDECVWLHANRDHCGACFNACRNGFAESRCLEGQCAPFRGECIYPDSGFENCATYCRQHDARCQLGEGGCSGPYDGFLGEDRACDGVGRIATARGIGEGCEDPIDWDARYGGEALGGVQCCCVY